MIMANIFKDVFEQLFNTNPLLGDQQESKPAKKEATKDKSHLTRDIIKILATEKQKPVKSDDLKKVDKQLNKNGFVEVVPISKRFTDDSATDKNRRLSLNEYDGKNTVEIDSTAIAEPIKYNEKTGEVWLRFKGKDGKPSGKWYHYVSMDKEQFESFMKSSSKGRYVTKVMKHKNHDPAYPVT